MLVGLFNLITSKVLAFDRAVFRRIGRWVEWSENACARLDRNSFLAAHYFGHRVIRVWERLFPAILTIIAGAVSLGILFYPGLRQAADVSPSIETLLSQLGATYGTILALILTLSLLPVQRASEVWSPSVVHLYLRDKGTIWSVILLGLFCLGCFAFSVDGIGGAPGSIIMAGAILSLGISLDLLRYYRTHVGRLLNPGYVVKAITEEAKTVIQKAVYTAHSISKHEGVPEASVYSRLSRYDAYINEKINDLTEIAIKAISRNDVMLVQQSIHSITDLVTRYLESRRASLLVFPGSVLGSTSSNVDVVLNHSCEALLQISRSASNKGDESSAIRVSEAYKAIAVCAASLRDERYSPSSAPLAHAPIYYALEGVKLSKTKGHDESSFQAAMMLSRVPAEVPRGVRYNDIFIPVASGAFDVALYLYAKRSFVLAEEVVGRQFETLKVMLNRDEQGFVESLIYALGKSKDMLPLALVNEQLDSRSPTVNALGKVYGLIHEASLGHLFALSLNKVIQSDDDRGHIAVAHRLLAAIAENLRELARNHEVAESFLIFNVTELLKQMAEHIVLVKSSDALRGFDWGQLVTEFQGGLNFFTWAHYKKKKMITDRMEESGEALVYIGLLFFRAGRIDILFECLRRVVSIVDAYCETTTAPDPYFIGDMYAHYWLVRMVFAAKGIAVGGVDNMLTAKPKTMSDERWAFCQEMIQLRRRQLEERLDGDRFSLPNKAVSLAARILQSPPDSEGDGDTE